VKRRPYIQKEQKEDVATKAAQDVSVRGRRCKSGSKGGKIKGNGSSLYALKKGPALTQPLAEEEKAPDRKGKKASQGWGRLLPCAEGESQNSEHTVREGKLLRLEG